MKKTIDDLGNIEGKRVFLRVDFNVPIDENGKITDDTRIKAALPTIKALLSKGARLVVCSHLGRPKGERKEEFSLMPVAKMLVTYLPLTKIKFSPTCIGERVEKMTKELKNGELLLLENIRFYKEEEKNDPIFAKKLARLADIYVGDAFGAAHRNHASIFGVPRLLPNAMGYLMGEEVNTILNVLDEAQRPFVAVLGGSKVSDKIYVIMNLLNRVDTIIIGGGMAYTFLAAKGVDVGASLVDEDKIPLAREILNEAEKYGKKILLPIDHVCGASISTNAKPIVVSKENIPEGLIGMDLGPKTISQYTKIIQKARTVIWNGPMGVFEYEKFSNGTYKIAKAVAKVKGDTFVGGGDSIASIHLLKLDGFIDHISTGGGASLQLLQGELLPGVEVIENVEPKFVPATKPPKRKKRKKEPKNKNPHIDLNMYVQE